MMQPYRYILLSGVAIATGTAHAAEKRLPKAFWGKWSACFHVVGPPFYYYMRNHCDDPPVPNPPKGQDMTIGPYTINSCKIIKIDRRRNERYEKITFRVTLGCKNYGDDIAEMWLEDDGLASRYTWEKQ